MAVGVAGSQGNVEIGFTPNATDVITLAGTTAGHPDGDITISGPFEKSRVRAGLVPIKSYVTSKDLRAAFALREVLLEHLQYSWYGDAKAAGPPAVLTMDEDVGASIALLIDTYAPNGAMGERVFSMPIADADGGGDYLIPRAQSGDGPTQSINLNFLALGNAASNGLLGTMTDTYA